MKQTPIKNITTRKDNNKFRVRIYINSKRVYLGQYSTLLEATEALLIGVKFKEIVERVSK